MIAAIVCTFLAGGLAGWAYRAWWAARRARSLECLRSVGRVAEEVADGDPAAFVLLDVARTLVDILDLDDCRLETGAQAIGIRPRLTHAGQLVWRGIAWSPARLGLPTRGFDLVMRVRGRIAGRFVCVPHRRVPVDEARLVAALALVDAASSARELDAAA